MNLSLWFRVQFWFSLFGGACAVAAFVGGVMQSRAWVAVLNVFSFGANAWFARNAWREAHPRTDAPRES